MSAWKECPNSSVEGRRQYSLGWLNPRIATTIGDGCCTIIGNTSLPPNKATSWSIKILKSKDNDGDDIRVGVAPSDINQNENYYFKECGWYLYCFNSTLWSGPPHNYSYKEYGPRKEKEEYVHTGDSVGVVMDTTKGELSFYLDGVNLGVAYEGIPLDKPLVPCVLLRWEGDSVELDTSEVKENVVDSSINPPNITVESTTWGSITLTWDDAVEGASFYQIEVDENKFWDASTTNTFTKREFLPETEHTFRVRAVKGKSVSEWSDVVKGRTQKIPSNFSEWNWEKCPKSVYKDKDHFIGDNYFRTPTKIVTKPPTLIGDTPLPLNKVTSWSITVRISKYAGRYVSIGVVPSGIDQKERFNSGKRGWYLRFFDSTLWSGPPHNYRDKKYGPRKGDGQYVHNGGSIGVVMDTTKGELSFVLDGVNLGAAFEGIPLDKPLVPCVILYHKEDSVKLDTSEVKETIVDSFIHTPSKIIAKGITWDSITLTWDKTEGASFYQIEVDGSKSWYSSTTNAFTKRELLPDTEHIFNVRAVREDSVSKWSNAVKGRTLEKESFEASGWKECPDNVYGNLKYSVNEENPRIATMIGVYDGYCTIIGNTPLPLNKVTSWSIKVLKSRVNNGDCIFIGVAPFDIDQREEDNYKKCGWYFGCYSSTLWSGPPHNYRRKEYGQMEERWGEYVHTGDVVGVVMDTANGELSFVRREVNLGVAYEGIPLDKPLVPCVLLGYEGDSVELDTYEVKKTVDSSFSVPSNITTKSAWDSITLTWSSVKGASFYQIEVNGSKFLDRSTTNTFTKRGLLPEAEHIFRVRAVRGNSVSEWSDIVEGRTQTDSFETSVWRECPDNVDEDRRYSIGWLNPRIATKVGKYDYCTIIGNTPLPLNKVTPWSIKILKSKGNDGNGINIGVAPSDINQNVDDNYDKCGWYFYCFDSTLWSGPPHNYSEKEYGPRRWRGEYVHTGYSVYVVMDTTKGNLSFALDGVNLGVAYGGIPLDKPLVPCVILGNKGDCVKLITNSIDIKNCIIA